jgi:hypothetical protein
MSTTFSSVVLKALQALGRLCAESAPFSPFGPFYWPSTTDQRPGACVEPRRFVARRDLISRGTSHEHRLLAHRTGIRRFSAPVARSGLTSPHTHLRAGA